MARLKDTVQSRPPCWPPNHPLPPTQCRAHHSYPKQTARLTTRHFLPASAPSTVMGKTEASPYPAPVQPYSPDTNPNPNYLPWHGHITCLTVAPSARRLGHATRLTQLLEQACDAEDAWFVDLFVRAENVVAQKLYEGMGYTIYRRVVGYYNDDTDAFDMRKPLSRDVGNKHIRENGRDVKVSPDEVW